VDLSIIIPSCNTKKLLQDCLVSVFKQTKNISFEVMVIDNASKYNIKNQISKIKNTYQKSNIILIQNKQNLGYAKANNQALRQAQGDYILFLNSDTVILNKAIENSLSFMEKERKVDILGCQLLNKNKTIQPSGGFFPQLSQIFYWMFFIDELPLLKRVIKPYQQSQKKFYKKTRELDWATGAFLLVKKRVVKKIKGFDERFFMYGEEVDFCYRAKRLGFKTWFYPEAKIIHLKSQSPGGGFEKSVLGEYQGVKKFYQKHQPPWQLPLLRLWLKIGALSRIFIFGILKGNKKKRKIYEKAFHLA
jgi:GT2 family glycosyltransferase